MEHPMSIAFRVLFTSSAADDVSFALDIFDKEK